MNAPRHVFQTHIRATADAVWHALTDPAFTRRYFHHTAIESTFRPGDPVRYVLPDGTDGVEGVIEEADPPRRLVMTWHVLYDAAMADEPPSRVEWLLTENGDGVTRVTTIHRDLGLSPLTSTDVADGWNWVLSSLKSLLETGTGLDGRAAPAPETAADWHRSMAMQLNNSAFELLGREQLSPDEADDLLERAYAAAHHWRRASGRQPAHGARASWLISRAHAAAGQGDLALHHADRCAEQVAAAGLGDFDLAYAHEARARALARLGRLDEARRELDAARTVPITDDEDRAIFDADLAAGAWFDLAVRP